MSAFKNIFRNTNHKDSSNPSWSASSGTTKHSKSLSAGSPSTSAQPTNGASGLAVSPIIGSTPVSPSSVPTKPPAIDVTDLSSLDSNAKSPVESTVSTIRVAESPTDRTSTATASQFNRSMGRPSSSGHGQWRSESVTRVDGTNGGKASRRSSKADRSDDGHGKPEVLNRHELMRRAMATAQDYDDSEGYESGSAIDDDHLSASQHSHTFHANHSPSSFTPSHQPQNSTPVIVRQAPPPGPPSDRPGDGSLSIDTFAPGQSHVINANGSGRPGGRASSFSPVKQTPSSAATSPTMTASATMPTLVTPAPKRAELPRSDSLEEIINHGNVYTPTQRSDAFVASPLDASASADKKGTASRSTSPARPTNQAMTKSASGGTLLKPTDTPAALATNARRPADSGSSAGLTPASLLRMRKNSDSSSISKVTKTKKSGPSGGIAGALAASSIAGMGVGHAAALQHTQAAVVESEAAAAKKNKKAAAGLGDDTQVMGFQGGIYRDPSTGTVVEKDQDGNQFQQRQRPFRDPSSSSVLTYEGSFASDRSSVSGLGAAAGFGAASAALLSSVGGVPGLPITPSLVTPDGTSAIGGGGLIPPEEGAADGQANHIDGETTWPEDMGPQITGFAVASSKRNNEFHQLFPQVPEDDYLIEDYGCALVREILIQGRLYISENHLCFKANIFGWVTNVVLPFSEVISIEKRMTAFVIPNAIQIATLQSKHNFTSFLSRDATYDLIVNIWKLSHPGVPIAAADQADLSDEYSEIDEEGDSSAQAATGADGKDGGEPKPSKRAKLKRKLKGTKTGVRDENLAAVAAAAARSGTPLIPQSSTPGPGGKRIPHRKTTCPCEEKKEHFSSVVLDTTYPAVPEKIYNLLFTSGFMKEFWINDQKLMDLQISDWSPDSEKRNLLSRNISYIKPLAGGFGPKQTKCVLTDENLHVDFDNYVVTLTTTRTPDVPSGGSFSVKTKTCITWEGTGNVSHVYVTCQVEWSGRSMLKSIIDKASLDGQKQYYKELDAAVRKYVTEHSSEFKEEGDDAAAVEEIARAATPGPNSKKGQAAAGQRSVSGDQGQAADPDPDGVAEGSGGAVGKIMDGLGMVGDLVGGVMEMQSDWVKSNTIAVFAVVITVLILSNVYTYRKASGAMASSRGMVDRLDQMHVAGVNKGYFDDQGYYGPTSPRRSSVGKEGDSPPVFDRIFAPNVYITAPGGNDATPEAIAKTVTEVVERLYQQNLDRFRTAPFGGAADDPEAVKKLLAETEAQLERIEKRLKALNQQAEGNGKRVEL